MSENHAKITVAGYEIPLIGIPNYAVLSECDWCGYEESIQHSLELTMEGLICKNCRDKNPGIFKKEAPASPKLPVSCNNAWSL